MKKRILCIITARGGSKGIPRKNMQLFLGKPLVAHAIEIAASAKTCTRVVVSSDDEEILETARVYGEIIPLRRPAEISTDASKSHSAVQHALQTIEAQDTTVYDATLLLQPTAPLTLPADLDAAVELFEREQCDGVVSVVKLRAHHPLRLTPFGSSSLVTYLAPTDIEQPRQSLGGIYVRNGAIYITSRQVLLNGSLYGSVTLGYEMPWQRSCDIDTSDDLVVAELFARHLQGRD